MTETVRCITCEKSLELDEDGLVRDAGFVVISFHFGSRHDQCYGFSRDRGRRKRIERLLACNKIEGFICDDCFDTKSKLCCGFDVERKVVEKRKV